MTDDGTADGAADATGDGDPAVELSAEQARQVAAVVDVCLERGFDVGGVDRTTLERARDRLQGRS